MRGGIEVNCYYMLRIDFFLVNLFELSINFLNNFGWFNFKKSLRDMYN